MDILNFFLREPERKFHIRELAKRLGKSPTTVSKYLKILEKEGLVTSDRKYNHFFYKANNETAKFKDLKIYHNIKIIRESGLVDYLNEKLNFPEAIILFGSFAKGENIVKSDIDLLIVTSIKKDLNLNKYEDKVGHSLQLFINSNKDINKMMKSNKELVNNWINGIVLEGNWELLR